MIFRCDGNQAVNMDTRYSMVENIVKKRYIVTIYCRDIAIAFDVKENVLSFYHIFMSLDI